MAIRLLWLPLKPIPLPAWPWAAPSPLQLPQPLHLLVLLLRCSCQAPLVLGGELGSGLLSFLAVRQVPGGQLLALPPQPLFPLLV